MNKEIRPLTEKELEKVVDYFLNLTPEDDLRMGSDRKNFMRRDEWVKLLIDDSKQPLEERKFFYLGWFHNNVLIGHCNINNIIFGKEAFIHLHLWVPELRKHGIGTIFFKKAIRYYFNHFSLKKILCEPKSDNPGPNKILIKCGFKLLKTYKTKPSMLSIKHEVNRYELIKTALFD
ncbi:MAG: hypothetical protein A3E87_06115 [Gammaproteobacteria bacterium RIFCSPHIGHO2_12_FULL_35_23]|nr:MAG: hypothetical protein A3E87_06115 [Gammaproteobacteria bacterium RIFCSPHIGHO2_12_FULL_35_23]